MLKQRTRGCSSLSRLLSADARYGEWYLRASRVSFLHRIVSSDELTRKNTDEPLRVSCCDICDPMLLDHTRPPVLTAAKKKNVTKGLPDRSAQLKLDDWREAVYKRDHRNAQFDAEAILPDALIEYIASMTPQYIAADNGLAKHLKSSWVWWTKYGLDLLTYTRSLQIIFTPQPKKSRGKKATLISEGSPANANPAADAWTVAASQSTDTAAITQPAQRTESKASTALSSAPGAQKRQLPDAAATGCTADLASSKRVRTSTDAPAPPYPVTPSSSSSANAGPSTSACTAPGPLYTATSNQLYISGTSSATQSLVARYAQIPYQYG